MKLFKSENGEVFGYDDYQVAIGLATDKVVMTDAEVEAHINPKPVPPTQGQVEAQRLIAYADPVTGSDRWFAEATRLSIMGAAEGEIETARVSGISRYAEIQLEYPWP